MKIRVIAATILLALCSANTGRKQDVICTIELSVLKSKKFGQLLSVVGKLDNRTDRKIYFDGSNSHIEIFKQQGKQLVGFLDDLITYKIINPDREEIFNEQRDSSERVIYNRATGEFTDSLARAFYRNLVSDNRFVKSKRDSAIVEDWMQLEFRRVGFAHPRQSYIETLDINSLPPGSYVFVFSFDDTRPIKPLLPHLVLPKFLNGYEKWSGKIVSDTLRLNVR